MRIGISDVCNGFVVLSTIDSQKTFSLSRYGKHWKPYCGSIDWNLRKEKACKGVKEKDG